MKTRNKATKGMAIAAMGIACALAVQAEELDARAEFEAELAGAAATADSAVPDQLDISAAVTIGTHANVKPQNAAITRSLYGANVEGGNVVLSYAPLGWPSQGGGKSVNARTYIFWQENGRVIGGQFDWQGTGQTVKTLENVIHGYLGGQRPPRGAPVWFCLVSIDGGQRTNVALSPTPW